MNDKLKRFKRYLQALKNARAEDTIIFDYKTDYFYLIPNQEKVNEK